MPLALLQSLERRYIGRASVNTLYMKLLITGCCGFVGSNLILKLGNDESMSEYQIIGIDNFTENYSVEFKRENLAELEKLSNFTFYHHDLLCGDTMINEIKPDYIVHLAAIPGVRKSLDDPIFYIRNNIEVFVKILEDARKNGIKNVTYASSSSVYGKNIEVPFCEHHAITSPQSSYACSKYSMEVYAKYYNDIYDMNTVGMRFFTVYGERGRPDMAPYKFLKAIAEGDEIQQYGDGSSYRDYTHVDDIVNGIIKIIEHRERDECGTLKEIYKLKAIYNLGRGQPIDLKKFINTCERVINARANVNVVQEQLGDVHHTYACIDEARRDFGYEPTVELLDGLQRTFEWMKSNGRIKM